MTSINIPPPLGLGRPSQKSKKYKLGKYELKGKKDEKKKKKKETIIKLPFKKNSHHTKSNSS